MQNQTSMWMLTRPILIVNNTLLEFIDENAFYFLFFFQMKIFDFNALPVKFEKFEKPEK